MSSFVIYHTANRSIEKYTHNHTSNAAVAEYFTSFKRDVEIQGYFIRNKRDFSQRLKSQHYNRLCFKFFPEY